MKQILRENTFFLLPYFVFLIIGDIFLFLYPKDSLHLYINDHHNSFADTFFPLITYLGDGWTALFITILAFIYKLRNGLLIGISFGVSSAITQFLKHEVFNDILRPAKFFENVNNLHLVPGVDPYLYNSFPSGHAATAFSVFLAVALITDRNYMKILLFILAALTGFSRVYLSQHFFDDVYAGSIIGVLTALFVFYFFERSRIINSFEWMDNSLLKKKAE